MTDEERLSLIVSESLNVLGYSEDMVKTRRIFYDKMTKLYTYYIQREDSDQYYTITGSKREGLAGFFESDYDLMITDTSVQCTDNPAAVTRDVTYIFELDRENVPHGYTKLRLAYRNNENALDLIENNLVGCGNGELYLASALVMSEMEDSLSRNDGRIAWKPRAGPSLPSIHNTPIIPTIQYDADDVLSFPCQCSEYLSDWFHRPRHYDWPSKIHLGIASILDAHVVPVGAKGSENDFLQWRICFTPAEVMLMQSLNETQWKLYKLLKMIKDDLLKPLGDLVTSYVMKNVVMWISELFPLEQFQPIYLLHKLQQCLYFLVISLYAENLPSYMIRQRNLFQGRLDTDNKKDHLRVLNELLQDGRAMVIRCPKLKDTMIQVYTAPEVARSEMRLRDGMEMMSMKSFDVPMDGLVDFILRLSQCSDHDEEINVMATFVEKNAERLSSLCDCPAEDITREATISAVRQTLDSDHPLVKMLCRK